MRRLFPAILPLLAGCSGVQTPLDPAADQAASIYSMWTLMLVVCSLFYLLVIGFLVWSVWRGRRAAPVEEPPASAHDPGLERGLAVWTGMILMGLTLLIAWSFFVDRGLASTRDDPALEVTLTGYQWWWRAEYQDPRPDKLFETANELHLPVGRTTRLTLRSSDVIHSFWVPNLAGKMDMIPGRENRLDITPRRIGVFRAQCAEFCGFQHAHMALTVVVESPADFAAWRAAQLQPAQVPTTAQLALGRSVLESNACAFCHKVDGTQAGGRTAPNLTHFASRPTIAAGTLPMTPENISRWVADPPGVKPGTKMPKVELSPAEHDAVVAYLGSLQ